MTDQELKQCYTDGLNVGKEFYPLLDEDKCQILSEIYSQFIQSELMQRLQAAVKREAVNEFLRGAQVGLMQAAKESGKMIS